MSRKYDLQHNCSYVSVIVAPVAPLVLFERKKTEPQPDRETVASGTNSCKLVGFPVARYDIVEDKVRFSNRVGLFKKRWVVAKEFPVYEITKVECLRNWISLSWNNEAYQFILTQKGGSFAKLAQQIAELQEIHQKDLQKTLQTELCRNELLAAIAASLPIVDCLFDILMGLHEKRVSWMRLKSYVQTLGGTFNFKPQTLMSLDLDFAKIAVAVQNQVAKETAQEALDSLRAIYGYFNEIESQEALADTVPNVEHVKAVVLAYFTLNDLWLAKIVGADTQNEFDAFKEQLVDLAEQTSFRADAADFSPVLTDTVALEASIWGVRMSFRERLKQL
ncbi:hypothetical protein [Candidatus Bathycorpusculum sp.]|uniref:hypothetical protein n=1 Tax=Candidatus Bathycorpusculum sp. TaxID=2994959 RepID=UPI002832BF8A|nr:hypothetical protein [Candidatus Termitimicrobium sp.]MCL2432422.1 hypothetical protein [Candidatus Termitimicrobium sp.]